MTEPLAPPATGPVAEEPVAILLAGLAGVVGLGLVAINALDWVTITGSEVGTIVAFVAGATALAGAVLRARVYSPATVARLLDTP